MFYAYLINVSSLRMILNESKQVVILNVHSVHRHTQLYNLIYKLIRQRVSANL